MSDAVATPHQERLPRTLGLWSAVAILVGITIGSGIFRVPAQIAETVNSPGIFLSVWVLGGLITLTGALSIAELAAMYPRSGGVLSYRAVLSTGTNVVAVNVPSNAAIGEIYARFRLSEQSNLGPTGDASSGEVEDLRLVVTNNPYQNPILRYDVNDSGVITPLDALQIINAIGRNDGNDIFLDQLPLPSMLPPYPDVTGDGVISSLDALQVINELSRLSNTSPSGEMPVGSDATTFVALPGGVMASGATWVGDVMLAADGEDPATTEVEVSTVTQAPEKTSVFDSAAVIDLDSIVDTLAEDSVSTRGQDSAGGDVNAALDELFASL